MVSNLIIRNCCNGQPASTTFEMGIIQRPQDGGSPSKTSAPHTAVRDRDLRHSAPKLVLCAGTRTSPVISSLKIMTSLAQGAACRKANAAE